MRAFADLTERGRARRLRPLALAALEEYSLDVESLVLITNSWNCVFRVNTPTGPYVLRITTPASDFGFNQLQSEVAFMDALATGSDIAVPTVIPTRHGSLVASATAPGVPDNRGCVVFSWLRGRELGERVTPERWQALGALSAKLHSFVDGWQGRPFPTDLVYDRVYHYRDSVVLFNDDEFLGDRFEMFRQAWLATDDRIKRLRGERIVTHGDLHQYNVLSYRGRLGVIDFEDHLWARPILDVSTTLYYVCGRDDYPELKRAFRKGYESVRPWVEDTEGQLETFYFGRALDLMNVVCADPEIDVGDRRKWVESKVALAQKALG